MLPSQTLIQGQENHSRSRSKGTWKQRRSHCVITPPGSCWSHVCALVCASMQTNHTHGYISGQWGHSQYLFISFIHVSLILTFSLKGVYYYYNHKNVSTSYFEKGSQRYGNSLIHVRLSLAPGMSITHRVPETAKGSKTHSNICAGNPCGIWNQLHSQEKREEMRIRYFVVSLVNMLWDHILFPFLSLLHWVTNSAARCPFFI